MATDKEVKEGAKQMASIMWELFSEFMKKTDGDIILSLQLASETFKAVAAQNNTTKGEVEIWSC